MTIALALMAYANGVRAECAPIVHADNAASACWIHNPPDWLRQIEDSRRLQAPVPVVHLWRSKRMQTLLALGVNRRGLPGLYIARALPY